MECSCVFWEPAGPDRLDEEGGRETLTLLLSFDYFPVETQGIVGPEAQLFFTFMLMVYVLKCHFSSEKSWSHRVTV